MTGLTWLAWRQQRWGVLAGVVLVVFYAYTTGSRSQLVWELDMRAGLFVSPTYVLPIGFGACWAAPLLARERQRRTVDLAYTQSISRIGWLAAWTAPVLAVSVMTTALVYLVFAAYPGVWMDGWYAHFTDMLPYAVATTMVAVGIGLCAGAVLGRTVPAIAVTIVGCLAEPYALRVLSIRLRDGTTYWDPVAFRFGVAAAFTAAAFAWMIRKVPS